MSWDLTAFDLPEDVVSLRTLAADFKLKSLGNRNEWIERVQRIVPGMQLQATGSIIFGYYATDDFRVQIGFGHDETIDSIAFHVYGDRKSTCLNSSHIPLSRMPSSACKKKHC